MRDRERWFAEFKKTQRLFGALHKVRSDNRRHRAKAPRLKDQSLALKLLLSSLTLVGLYSEDDTYM
jgi:hypothetical protein